MTSNDVGDHAKSGQVQERYRAIEADTYQHPAPSTVATRRNQLIKQSTMNQKSFILYAQRFTSTPKQCFNKQQAPPLTSTPIRKCEKTRKSTHPYRSRKLSKRIDLARLLHLNIPEHIRIKQQRQRKKYYSTKIKIWIV
ncbi:unnamed protein product [Didymodactylos carnosus]|uniref:Uncharacterized protein n=1 Tax=Didymodactylos carnosus TaxID=1234261 RepID=A0A814D6N2_9BILA|nr:unnamed protein product [Didymodactylos carnosus]CAF1273546.1 unnamed protein product [Didymodactylos carnosus]CAF3729424.1 unnamed protein product [Didymodactylos carnosus]CAF4078768.1 unnamed protein product [Didymodactylos carnosus]